MGVDITTYRCRVGSFVSCRGAGVPFFMSFSQLVNFIGSLSFIRILLVMAGVETNPGPIEKFIFRYQYLLVEIGTTLIRRLFEVKVGHDCAKHLTQTTVAQTLQKLITAKKIASDQAQYLPPVDMTPDSSNFDISLLTCLLRHVCGLRQPKDTVWMNPSPTDTSEEADIARLRLCRNWLMHRDTLVLPEAEFDDKWKELTGIFIRLNTSCGITGLSALIDDASKIDTDEELKDRYDQALKAWDSIDQDVILKLDRFEKRSAIGHDEVVETLKTIKPEIAAVQKEVKEGLSTVQQEVTTVHQGLSTVQQEVKQGLETVKQEVTTVQQGLTTVQQDVKLGMSTLQQEVTTVNQGLSTVQQEVKQGLETVKQEVTTVQQGLTTVQQDVKLGMSTLEQKVSTVHQGLTTIQQEVKQGFSTMQQEMKQGLTTVQQEVKQGLSTVQQEVKQGLTTVQQEVATVQQCLTTVSQDVPSIQQVSTVQQEIQQGVTTVQQVVTTVQQWLSTVQPEVQQELSNVQQDVQQGLLIEPQGVSTVQQGLTTVQQGMTTVQKGMTTMQQDMSNLKSLPRKDVKVIQEKLITTYQRDCRWLHVSPFIEDDNEDLMSIYQSPTLHRTVYDNDNIKDELRAVSSYKEIFCQDNKTFKHVYITGDAGVGKSSLCRRMCLLWSKSRSGGDAGNDEGTKRDMKFLEKFDFLFFVSPCATDRTDIIMIIVDQLFYTECHDERTDMYTLIKSILNQHDSLIVLDGVDEWNPTPKGIESEKCVFLTTCRPYKLANIRLSWNDIDHQLEMTGIHGLSSRQYVIKVVKYMNKKNHDNKNAGQFLKEVMRCDLYDQLCIPMISSHLVVIWWFNQTLARFSKAFLYGKTLEMLFKIAERDVEFLSLTPSELKLPNCFSHLDYVNEHVPVLKKVCLLSFNALFKQDDCASTLLFTSKQLMSSPYLFTSEEMDFLCKIRIISKNKDIGCFEEKQRLLSFVHTCYIDFFGALYVSSFDECNMMDGVVETWSSLDDVLKYQDFFVFLAGLSGQKLKFLIEKIYSVLSDHLNLLRNCAMVNCQSDIHLDVGNVYMKLLRLFQTIVINCFIEIHRSDEPHIVLKLEDFIVDININSDIRKQLLLLNSTCVKSIIYDCNGKYYDFDQIKHLQFLHVDDVSSGDYVKVSELMLQNHSTLRTVHIDGNSGSYTLIPELPVRSLVHLTSLSLYRVEIPHNSKHNMVKFLSDNVLIENIKLSHVACDNHMFGDSDCTLTLNLQHHTKLTSLCLYYVNMLCNNLNNSSLKSIVFCKPTERIDRCCIDVFNCIKDSQLEHFHIDGYPFVWLDKNETKILTCSVETLPYIKSLTLNNMKLSDDDLLQLHPDVTQMKIFLHNVVMSSQWFHYFIESFVNNTSMIKVKMCWYEIILDGKTLSEFKSMDYISEYLTSIPTVNITNKDIKNFVFETNHC